MSPRCLLLFVATLAWALAADDPGGLPPYVTPANTTHTLRLWGSAPLAPVVKQWVEGFRKLHPEIAIETRLDGTGLAMPGIYTGAADIALFGREPNRTDNDAFLHALNYPPLRIEVATGSADVPGHSVAPALFVHRDNPLTRLTLGQLDALFGYERRRGAPRPLRTWGDLGLVGEWADRPINLYACDVRSGPGIFFQRTVLKDSAKWNWERLTELSDGPDGTGRVRRACERILAALSADRDGLAIASLGPATPQVKPLAIATDEGGKYVLPTAETVAARSYPLARAVYVCVNRRPGAEVDPKTKAFVRYVLSPAGQSAVAQTGIYLPLSRELARSQQELLD